MAPIVLVEAVKISVMAPVTSTAVVSRHGFIKAGERIRTVDIQLGKVHKDRPKKLVFNRENTCFAPVGS